MEKKLKRMQKKEFCVCNFVRKSVESSKAVKEKVQEFVQQLVTG
jgi:hypothetical protein